MKKTHPLDILLIDDDPADQKLITKALKSAQFVEEVYVAPTAEEALDFLAQHTERLDIILLDLNMPGMGGKAFLKKIKTSEKFKIIPVIILTTSDAFEDILETYHLQAAGYITKPAHFDGLKDMGNILKQYWSELCELPN